MFETLIALGILAAMGAVAGGLAFGTETWLLAGFWLSVCGLGFGVPTGLAYHVALHRALKIANALPPGWYWRPTSLHDRIPDDQRALVMLLGGAGALGFVLCVAGCVVVTAALIRGL